jgi:hypothetical protein
MLYADLELPPDFPRDAIEALGGRLADDSTGYLSVDFSTAWLAMAYRFRTTVEAVDSWSLSVSTPAGDAPPMNVRYGQERDLFAFTTNACSVMDCLAFGIAAASRRPQFDLASNDGRSRVSFNSLARRARAAFGDSPLSTTLKET